MDNKQLAILSSPLRKIEQAAEVMNNHLFAIRGFVEFSATRAHDSLTQLEKQTSLLESIDKKIEKIAGAASGKNAKKDSAGKKAAVDTPAKKLDLSKEDIDVSTQMIVAIAGAIFAAAVIFTFIPVLSPAQLLTALAIAGVMALVAPSFVKIADALNKIKLGTENNKKFSGSGVGDVWSMMGATLVTMVGISAAITLSSWALALIYPLSMAQLGTALLISIMMIGLSMAFVQILTAFRKGKIKPDANGAKTVAMAGIVMVSLAVAVSLSSWILTTIAIVEPQKLFSAFLIGLAMVPIAFAFAMVVKQLKKATLKQVGLAAAAIPLIAIGLSLAAHIFNYMLPDTYKAPPTDWVLLTGFTIAVFAVSFYLVAKAVKGLGPFELLFAALAIPLIAIAVLGTAYVFQLLANVEEFTSPPLEWTASAALTIFLFAIPFALISIVIGKFGLGFKELGLGLLSTIAISLAIVGVAFIFQLLSYVGEYLTVPVEWAKATGAALLIFAVPLLAIGLIAKTGGGAAALGFGLLGMVLTAVAIGLVALIFTGIGNIPGFKKGMQNVVDVLFMPFNSMVDVLTRIKEEIGIDNLLPLAGGILAIAGAWLALTAAMAGSAVGGLFGAAANVGKAVLDGISSIFGGEKAKTPFDLLNLLISSSSNIIAMADPIEKFGKNFGTIAGNAENVIKGLAAFIPFMNEDKQETLTKSANALEKMAGAYTTISTASNSINIEALKLTKGMFEALAKIANAPKDNPLTKLSENLFKAVNELTEVVNNLEQAVGTQTSGADKFMGVLKSVGERIGAVKEKVQEQSADKGSGSMDLTPLIAAISELEERLNQPIYTIEVED